MPDKETRRRSFVAAAVSLLDDEGLDGLSMRRLSQRTGASATSVYWYFDGGKDELVGLTLDAVITEVELPDIEAVGWRQAAATMARGFRAMMLRHPWLGLVAASYAGAQGPNLARHNEHVIAVYEAAGLRGDDGAHAENTVYSFALGAAVGEAGVRAWRPGAGEDDAKDTEAVLARARGELADWPRLSARIESLTGVDSAAMSEAAFEFGLETILDGLEARAAAAS